VVIECQADLFGVAAAISATVEMIVAIPTSRQDVERLERPNNSVHSVAARLLLVACSDVSMAAG
jgi:hypothetical protein